MTNSNRNPERPAIRLLFNGQEYGPVFHTQVEAEEFAQYCHQRSGMDWFQQSEKTLELLAQEFRRQR